MAREITDIHGTVYGTVMKATNANGETTGIIIRLNPDKAKDMAEALEDTIWHEAIALGNAIHEELNA